MGMWVFCMLCSSFSLIICMVLVSWNSVVKNIRLVFSCSNLGVVGWVGFRNSLIRNCGNSMNIVM